MLWKVTQLIFSSDSRFANLMKPYFIHKRIKIREILLLIKIIISFFKKLRRGKKRTDSWRKSRSTGSQSVT